MNPQRESPIRAQNSNRSSSVAREAGLMLARPCHLGARDDGRRDRPRERARPDGVRPLSPRPHRPRSRGARLGPGIACGHGALPRQGARRPGARGRPPPDRDRDGNPVGGCDGRAGGGCSTSCASGGRAGGVAAVPRGGTRGVGIPLHGVDDGGLPDDAAGNRDSLDVSRQERRRAGSRRRAPGGGHRRDRRRHRLRRRVQPDLRSRRISPLRAMARTPQGKQRGDDERDPDIRPPCLVRRPQLPRIPDGRPGPPAGAQGNGIRRSL